MNEVVELCVDKNVQREWMDSCTKYIYRINMFDRSAGWLDDIFARNFE